MAMLRTTASRSLKAAQVTGSAKRGLATPASPAFDFTVNQAGPYKTASHDDKQSTTSAISIVLKAGPRYEPSPGLAHALKNFVFRTTNKRSALRVVRETEIYGGVLSSSLSREHLFLTAEFLRGDEAYFAEILGDVLGESKLSAHEFNEEVVPQLQSEYAQASSDSKTLALDAIHQLAFRKGLGNSMFATPHLEVSYDNALSFAKSTLSNSSDVAVVASGVDANTLQSLVADYFPSSSSNASTPASASQSGYFGGEVRLPSNTHGVGEHGKAHSEHAHILAGFKGGPASAVEYTVLRYLLGGEPSVKWSNGTTAFATSALGAKAFNLGYSDTGLVGFSVDSTTAEAGDIARKAVAALKSIGSGSIKDEDLKKAIAKAKFAVASQLESRTGGLELIGSQLMGGSTSDLLAALDKVTGEAVSKAAASAIKSKPSLVVVGNVHQLPFADELF